MNRINTTKIIHLLMKKNSEITNFIRTLIEKGKPNQTDITKLEKLSKERKLIAKNISDPMVEETTRRNDEFLKELKKMLIINK